MTAPTIDWRERYRAQLRCGTLGHPGALWVRRVTQQHTGICYYCETCDRPVTDDRYPRERKGWAVTAEWLRETLGIDATELPERRRDMRYQLCYLCGATALCEWHHVAPQALYGDDADRYPVVPLCDECHAKETSDFTERLERYVAARIREFQRKQVLEPAGR